MAADASTAMTRPHERRKRGRHLASAAAQVADRPFGVRECRKRRQVNALAEEIIAHPVPLSGRRREKFLRLRAALGKHRLHAALIVHGGGRRPDLLAHERPQPARRCIEIVARHRIHVAGAFGARRNPAAVGQCLQMAAHRRLRQLHDAAELRDGQLVAVEQQQQAAARGVGQGRQMVENRGRSCDSHQSVNPD